MNLNTLCNAVYNKAKNPTQPAPSDIILFKNLFMLTFCFEVLTCTNDPPLSPLTVYTHFLPMN